ncbi:MAG: phosphotransferase KptA/Tpt1 [Frankiales bacterium]|nr:phosphotransferase KptA/Tpt1 [Frankiales bacterium]
MTRDLTRLSRPLSFLLRHRPDAAGLVLDPAGWTAVGPVLVALGCDRATLEQLVREDAKQRYALEADRIRAQQGHSVAVDLGLSPQRPPEVLWHGTAERSLPAVLQQGLLPRKRTHVHLSPDPATARQVGARHGRPAVLRVDAAAAWRAGRVFLLTGNGVWLTSAVPPAFLQVQR